MKISFSKYHGTGNDFVLIDNRNGEMINPGSEWVKNICHRRFGIGADGLILLQLKEGYDFEMVYFNSDGNQSSMCGNGGRCIVAFARKLNLIKESAKFLAIDGPHAATITEYDENSALVSLKMGNVESIETNPGYYLLNTGSPHYVTFVNAIRDLNVNEEGRKIRTSSRFANEGVNVNFVMPDQELLHVRTYERGVEAETWSCGTGVTAVALVAALKNPERNMFGLSTPGGNLEVSFERKGQAFENIILKGPAAFVFEGIIEIKK